MDFEGRWLSSFGSPELSGSWFVWGGSGSGKTRFVLQLSKYLTQFGRVAYNSLEEGNSESLAMAFREVGMEQVGRRIVLLDNEPIAEMAQRLRQHKSPNIIIIDSLQYTGMTYTDYKALRDEFRNKLFIIISHAEGREPAGKVARSVKFDAMIKIRVEGYKAFVASRYGGGEPFVIWDEGATKFWKLDDNL